MKLRLAALSTLAMAVSLTGCRMCQSPFDYCGSVIGPGRSLNCDWGARRGSILAPMDDGYVDTPMSPTLAEPSVEGAAASSRESSSETTANYDAVDTLVR